MEINISPESIDEYLKNAVIKSAMGATIQKSIDNALDDLLNSWNTPVKDEVEKIIRKLTREYLNLPEQHEKIYAEIKNVFTEEAIKKVVHYGLEHLKQLR